MLLSQSQSPRPKPKHGREPKAQQLAWSAESTHIYCLNVSYNFMERTENKKDIYISNDRQHSISVSSTSAGGKNPPDSSLSRKSGFTNRNQNQSR